MMIRSLRSFAVPMLLVVPFAACAGSRESYVDPVDVDEAPRQANERLEDGLARQKTEQQQRTSEGRTSEAGRDAQPSQPSTETTSGSQPSWLALAQDFASQVADRSDKVRGRIAVFPPLFRSPAANRWQVTKGGERIASEIALKLQSAGRNVVYGPDLLAAIERSNRGLDALTDEASAIALAKRLAGVSYVDGVVTGTIDVTEEGNFGARKVIDIALQSTSFSRLGSAYREDLQIRDPNASKGALRDLSGRGDWQIGAAAEPFEPTVDREFDVLATAVLARMFDANPKLFLERRVLVQPLEVAATSAQMQALAAQGKAISNQLDASERRAREAGKPDPWQQALEGELTVGGRTFASGNDALLAYQQERAKVMGSRAGLLTRDLADSMGETIRYLAGEKVTIVKADDRRAGVALVLADVLEAKTDGGIDLDSIGEVISKTADVVVRANLRRRIEEWRLNVTVMDLADPNDQRVESIVLPDWMIGPLTRALGN